MLENHIYHGNCLEVLSEFKSESIDLIVCDPPFGITANKWDKVIDIDDMWKNYKRIIKPNGAILLFGNGLFSARNICAAFDIYRYSIIWKKNKPRGFLNAKKQPLRIHEDINVFYKNQPIYNPQKTYGHKPVNSYTKRSSDGSNYGKTKLGYSGGGSTERYPVSIIEFSVVNNDTVKRVHSTQKPVELGSYLIKTYSNENCLILDNACGSGSFMVAAKKNNRRYIGIDIDADCVEKTKWRLENE